MVSTRIKDYVGHGTAANMPTPPDIPADGTAFYFQDDTGKALQWTGTGWLWVNPMPPGGLAGQVLSKIDGTDFNAHWVTPGGEGGWPTFEIINAVGADIVHTIADTAGYFMLMGGNIFNQQNITLPANPVDGQMLFIRCDYYSFGAYTLLPNAGQTSTPPTTGHVQGYDTRKFTLATLNWTTVPGMPQ